MSRSFPLISKDKVGGIGASADRAGRASPQAATRLDHPATIDLPGHTPGPWEVWPEVESGDRDRHLVYISVGPKDRRRVASTAVYGRKRNAAQNGSARVIPEDECRANARLIAAAPDLLSALIDALTALDMEGVCTSACVACEKARAAIAKATGAA